VTFRQDLAERAGWTFVQTMVGTFLASGVLDAAAVSGTLDVDTVRRAAIAAVAGAIGAALSVVKGYAARRVGNPNSAATVRRSDVEND
jgi:hypothetical protein